MYCPNCSAEASADQKFCRSCGMEVQAVAELINSQTDITRPEKRKEGGVQGAQHTMLIWGMIIMFAAVAAAVSLKILGKEQIQPAGDFTPYLSVIMLFIAFFGMALMCYSYLHTVPPQSRKRTSTRDVEYKPDARLLAGEPSSVTEQTTRFLEPSEPRIERDTAPHGEEKVDRLLSGKDELR